MRLTISGQPPAENERCSQHYNSIEASDANSRTTAGRLEHVVRLENLEAHYEAFRRSRRLPQPAGTCGVKRRLQRSALTKMLGLALPGFNMEFTVTEDFIF